MKFRPLTDRILIKRTEAEEMTKGGLFIPDTAKEKPMWGKAVAVGPGKTLDNGQTKPLEIKEGQTVLFRKYAGSDISLQGEDYLILREEEILAIAE